MKKVLSVVFLSLMAAVTQAQTLSPAIATVTYDLSQAALPTIPDVTLTAPNAAGYFYNTQITAGFDNVVSVTPSVGYLLAGTSTTVRLTLNATGLSALAVGSYPVLVSFVPLYANPLQANANTLSLLLTVNITNSRTYVLPGANDRTIPHIATGGVWKTRIRLVNTSSSISINSLQFFNDAGVATNYLVNGFSTQYVPAVTVPAKGVVDVLVDSVQPQSGTAMVHTVQGSVPGINVVFVSTTPNFQSAIEVKPSSASGFSVAFDNTAATRRSTGIAISNALNYPQTATLEFLDANGVNLLPITTTPLTAVVPAGGHIIFVMDQAYTFTQNRTGVLRVTGTQPTLTGFGLVLDLVNGFFFTEPAFLN